MSLLPSAPRKFSTEIPQDAAWSSQAVIQIAFGKASQRVVDLRVDRDPFAHQARAGAIAAFSGYTDLLDPRLPRRCFDHVDPSTYLAPIFVGWHEEIRFEGDE
jgi:hypothetical protein